MHVARSVRKARGIDEDKGTKAFRSPTCVSTALFSEESDVDDEESVMEGARRKSITPTDANEDEA